MENNINFLAGSKEALDNAKRLISCADAIAAIGQHGPANSLLILAIEECVKAGFLYYCMVDTDLQQDPVKLNKLLREHPNKHYLGFLTLLIIETANKIAANEDIFSKLNNQFNEIDQNKIDINSIAQMIAEVTDKFSTQIFAEIEASLSEESGTIASKAWWKNANRLRNYGFYVDHKNGNWITPLDIQEKDFQNSKEIVSKLIMEIESYKTPTTEGLVILRELIGHIKTQRNGKEIQLPEL